MRRNPLGDLVLGIAGGALSSYYLFGAILVLFTGHALALGPVLPLVPTPETGAFFYITVRLVQSFYHVGLACLVFLGFRFLQELLRGRTVVQACKEAAELPHLWF